MVKVKAKLEECTERVNISRRTFRLRMRSGKAELEGSWEILKIPVQNDEEMKLRGHQHCAEQRSAEWRGERRAPVQPRLAGLGPFSVSWFVAV